MEAKKLYQFYLKNSQTEEYLAAAKAINAKLRVAGLTFWLLVEEPNREGQQREALDALAAQAQGLDMMGY